MTSSSARRSPLTPAEPSLPYEDWLVERLKDPEEAAAYLEAAIEQGHEGALMLALRHVAMAQGGIAAVAKRAKLTREAAYRILSKSGNPELRSLSAILAAAGLKLAVRPIGKPAGVAQKTARYRVPRQPSATTMRAMKQARTIVKPRFGSAQELFDGLEKGRQGQGRNAAAKKRLHKRVSKRLDRAPG